MWKIATNLFKSSQQAAIENGNCFKALRRIPMSELESKLGRAAVRLIRGYVYRYYPGPDTGTPAMPRAEGWFVPTAIFNRVAEGSGWTLDDYAEALYWKLKEEQRHNRKIIVGAVLGSLPAVLAMVTLSLVINIPLMAMGGLPAVGGMLLSAVAGLVAGRFITARFDKAKQQLQRSFGY